MKNVPFSSALDSLGYYYDLDESYDESDEEEVKAHLRRVMEQPPLKLDTSSEVLEQTLEAFTLLFTILVVARL